MNARRLGLALCACVAPLAGCLDDEIAGGSVIGPLAGPRVAESVLALDVLDGVPLGITGTFAQGEMVNLWVHWEALQPPHTAEAVWFDPNADESASTLLDIDDPAVEQVTVFSLELTNLSMLGRWDVELFLDDELMRSHSFLVVDLLPGESVGLKIED